MKRSSFIKSLIIAVTAPAVLLGATPEKDIVPPSNTSTPGAEPNLPFDRLRIYLDPSTEIRVGDLIHSDLGDVAYVVALSFLPQHTVADVMPVIARTYRYSDLNNFRIMFNAVR
jgi:hypothetical protein